jgi:tetratricopeptide (TPR) repeat protein
MKKATVVVLVLSLALAPVITLPQPVYAADEGDDSAGIAVIIVLVGCAVAAIVLGVTGAMDEGEAKQKAEKEKKAIAAQAAKLKEDRAAKKQAFKKTARDYNANPGKYKLTEEARKYFVQAEGAFGDKSYKDAVELYNKGLDAAPWYAMGHYNLAIIYGEQTGDYEGAILEMEQYLQLSPNAADARAAQDKIYDWERKEGKSGVEEKPEQGKKGPTP